MTMRGFSLLELIIVIALLAMLASLSLPFYNSFYSGQQLEGVAAELRDNLRLAQSKAQAQVQDSAWGIRFTETNYTLFSAQSGVNDQTTPVPNGIILAADDVMFEKLTGIPEFAATITISDSRINSSKIITINAQGLVQ